jgi:hypothetical protein
MAFSRFFFIVYSFSRHLFTSFVFLWNCARCGPPTITHVPSATAYPPKSLLGRLQRLPGQSQPHYALLVVASSEASARSVIVTPRLSYSRPACPHSCPQPPLAMPWPATAARSQPFVCVPCVHSRVIGSLHAAYPGSLEAGCASLVVWSSYKAASRHAKASAGPGSGKKWELAVFAESGSRGAKMRCFNKRAEKKRLLGPRYTCYQSLSPPDLIVYIRKPIKM